MLSKRKTLFAVFSLLFLVWIMRSEGLNALALMESAKAADQIDPFFTAFNKFFSWIGAFAHFLIYILTAICGMLLDPGFMNLRTDGQSMGATLLKIWQISRNITNILLAFLLIIGAIMTVVFAEGGYVQKYAVKFVLAVILVNFSWFFPRVVLDLANILTATVYSLPSAINTPCIAYKENGDPDPDGCKVITDYAFFQNVEPPGMTCPIDFGGQKIICVKEEVLDADANTPNAIMGALVNNHARFKYFERVVKPQGANNPFAGPAQLARLPQLLTFTLLMSIMVFFSIALLFPLLALTLVLLIRIPIIWITVAFMPFMFIGFVAGDSGALKAFNPMEIWNKFVHAAFIPVVTAIPFSIGFIMINVATANPPTGWNPDHPFLRKMGLPALPGTNNLWQIVWVGMAIAVVWMGAKAAFKMDALFEKFAAPIMNAGGSMGKLFMKLPLLLPLPLPGGATPLAALRVAANPEQAFIDPMGKFRIPEMIGGAPGPAGAAATKIANHVNVTVSIQHNLTNAVRDFNGAANEALRNQAFERIRTEIEKINRDQNLKIDTSNNRTIADIMRKISEKTPAVERIRDETKIKP
ncbi:MAG: hypothetical protein PHX87_03570 [Candidatus Peribacteraceae bacterium]|nr:hypothetical protein [Candidatus Peribacteraceae bacterium]MDD5742485.1 hypothetical protein [Candidatus Peribacteraceae bacterium]